MDELKVLRSLKSYPEGKSTDPSTSIDRDLRWGHTCRWPTHSSRTSKEMADLGDGDVQQLVDMR